MVSMCLPSDALLQHLPSYLGFSYLGCGVSLHGCSSKAQPLLLTLDMGLLLSAAARDLRHGDFAEALRWGDPSRPKSGAATESVRLPRCRSSREELPHVQCQGGGRDELPHAGGQVWLLRWALSLSSCKARSAGRRWRWEGSKWRCFLNLSFTGRTGSFPMLSSLFNDWAIYFSPCLRPYWLRLGPLAVLATNETGQTSNRFSERDLIADSIYLSQLP